MAETITRIPSGFWCHIPDAWHGIAFIFIVDVVLLMWVFLSPLVIDVSVELRWK